MSLLKRIDNSDILTQDVDRLVQFYHGALELPFHLPYVAEEKWAAIDAGNLTFFIFEGLVGDHAPRRTPTNADNAPGLDSFAFEIENLEEALEWLERKLEGNVDWADEGITKWEHPSGAWYRWRGFYDPDGNLLYVTEPHRA
jgi:catechol 2,3-dioxygenase-like lactoylglutathione lyase family enzyme